MDLLGERSRGPLAMAPLAAKSRTKSRRSSRDIDTAKRDGFGGGAVESGQGGEDATAEVIGNEV